MNETNDIETLIKEIKELKEAVKKLEGDIEDIKYFTPVQKPILDKDMVKTIGGILIGALIIIGIFFS